MFDAALRRRLNPILDSCGRVLAARGATPDAVTLVGLALGLGAAALIAFGLPLWGLVLLALSRIADGLDGAVARATRTTDFGGFLDISADFVFYGAVPLGFVLNDPAANGAAGAFLIATFYVNGATFLGYAVLAERRRLTSAARGVKNLYYSGGLLEGTETIVFFVALCLLPRAFAPLAWGFGALTLATASGRVLGARKLFGDSRA